jgi:hypothetical protein
VPEGTGEAIRVKLENFQIPAVSSVGWRNLVHLACGDLRRPPTPPVFQMTADRFLALQNYLFWPTDVLFRWNIFWNDRFPPRPPPPPTPNPVRRAFHHCTQDRQRFITDHWRRRTYRQCVISFKTYGLGFTAFPPVLVLSFVGAVAIAVVVVII